MSRSPEFNFQQPHGGSQPSIMRSDALFWCAGKHADRTLYTKERKEGRKEERKKGRKKEKRKKERKRKKKQPTKSK